jgi:hypothetical protein
MLSGQTLVLDPYPGLKPRARSFHLFGIICPQTNPRSPNPFEDEDEYEDETKGWWLLG